MWLYDVEAFVAGWASIASEVVIVFNLVPQSRAQWHYHLVPIVAGVTLIGAAFTDALEWEMCAFAFAVATTFNLYNTWLLNVCLFRKYVDTTHEDWIRTLLLPRFTFGCAGTTVQLAYSLVGIAHLTVRACALSHAIRSL